MSEGRPGTLCGVFRGRPGSPCSCCRRAATEEAPVAPGNGTAVQGISPLMTNSVLCADCRSWLVHRTDWDADLTLTLSLTLTLCCQMMSRHACTQILRVIDSLQLTAKHSVATPVNWKHGDRVVAVPGLSDDQVTQKVRGTPAAHNAARHCARRVGSETCTAPLAAHR